MFEHYTKMAFKAFIRFKLHSIISLASLVFGFVCFIAASLLSNYTQSFDQHFPNADKTYNIIQNYIGDIPDTASTYNSGNCAAVRQPSLPPSSASAASETLAATWPKSAPFFS